MTILTFPTDKRHARIRSEFRLSIGLSSWVQEALNELGFDRREEIAVELEEAAKRVRSRIDTGRKE